jgi:hypothetical protein
MQTYTFLPILSSKKSTYIRLMFPALNLPECQLILRNPDGKPEVFDPARRRYVRLTPEEWVRQHLIHYLNHHLAYPLSHMSIEKQLSVHQLTKRADILVYDEKFNASLLIECKAPEVELTNKVFEQVARYNITYKVPWLLISNGMIHHAAYISHADRRIITLDHIPLYSALLTKPADH